MSGFTQNQREAIELRGNVLVVAGAGTGKTRTLVQRCVEWLLQKPGENSLDQVLMVTFTNAAATEMRQRIRDELKKVLQTSGHHAHLTEQLALLDTAFISTLHSFCFRLVRQHFYELELDPQLAILPDEESRLLASETLSALLEKHYTEQTPRSEAVRRLIQVQARGWDAPVRSLILRLHHYTQTLPDPKGWFSSQLSLFAEPKATRWQGWLQSAVAEWKDLWLPLLEAFGRDNANLAACIGALQGLPATPNFAQANEAFAAIAKAHSQPWPRGSVGAIRDRIKDFFREAEFLSSLTGRGVLPPVLNEDPRPAATPGLPATDDPLQQDWDWVRLQMITLLELAVEFGTQFAGAKRELGAVDFHDLEQFSLRLLWDLDAQSPTPLAEQWRKKLRLIFVDEYQDINAAQDAILRALGGEGRSANRFLVGDPKQSIYRFRLADPHIFQEYIERWKSHASGGHVIALTENFRSRERILQFINGLFEGVMRRELGGGQYDETARLRFGDPAGRQELSAHYVEKPHHFPAGPSEPARTPGRCSEGGPLAAVEFHLRLTGGGRSGESLSEDGTEEEEGLPANLTNAETEARLVGLRLAELRASQHLIWDVHLGQHRPVEWRDMVILLRSPQHKVEGYAKEFSRLGIPLSATRGGFFDTPEVMDLVSLLTLLDNPLQDVPVLAVLRSPFVMLTFDELAIIRLASKGRYWTALRQFHRLLEHGAERSATTPEASPRSLGEDPMGKLRAALRDPTLRQVADAAWAKVDSFLRQFAMWRRLARETSLSQCLERILTETGYETLLLAQARAQQPRGNVSKLVTWARQFDQFHRQGLYRFLRFVDAQKEAQMDHEPAPLDTQEAVRLMSIHQSKGLEFGVVVIGDLGKPFNLADLKSELILDEQYGLCPLIKPPFTQQRYPSLPYWLAQRRQRRELLGEEVRLLYVGLTRACQCLILAGTASRTSAERWSKQTTPLPTRELLAATTYLDWLAPWISEATGRQDWFECTDGTSELLRWVVYEENDPRLRKPEQHSETLPERDQFMADPNPSLLQALTEKLAWRYPLSLATAEPAKLSVSTLRAGILAQLADGEESMRRSLPSAASPKSRRGLSAAAVGIAHHLFLQFVSIDSLQDPKAFESEAERMERERILSPAERQALDLEALARFWRSSIGREILSHPNEIHREMPFTARLDLAELRDFQQDQTAVLGHSLSTSQSKRRGTKTRYSDQLSLAIAAPSEHNGGAPIAPELLRQEFVILTGVVDLVVLLPQEIWILDFKTDAVNNEEWKQKARIYEPQMKLYALALSRIYARPVTRLWLHSLALRQTVQCS